jgi:hypothetical protein
MSHFFRASAATLLLSIGLLSDAPPPASAEDCPVEILYVVESRICVDSASLKALDPSCCARLEALATNSDGSAKRIELPKQCPEAPIGYVKQTGRCTSNGKAIDLACCDAIR